VKTADFRAAFDQEVGGFLRDSGFALRSVLDYRRDLPDGGFDRAAVDVHAGKLRFWVMLSHYPAALRVLEELNPSGHELGFPCGPYLTPAGVFRKGGGWSFRNRDEASRSFDLVRLAITDIGLPWLGALRDPAVFLEAVDQHSLLAHALALEAVGDFARARARYSELQGRFISMIEENGTDRLVLRDMGKLFIFVCEKLGVERERVAFFRLRLGFQMPVGSCPPASDGVQQRA
jgi:hypothetical protein